MKERSIETPLVDEHLKSLEGMKEPETNEFFYTRLKAKMMNRQSGERISLRWVYATITIMLLILTVNIFAWRNVSASNKANSSIQQLVQEYGWTSNDLYSNNSN
jgi:hypothetical protein